MAGVLGILDSLLVALALGAGGIRSRVDSAREMGIQLVTTEAAIDAARELLFKIRRPMERGPWPG